jgi:hypothetical protein
MTASAQPGPLSITGQNPSIVGPTPYVGGPAALVDSNPDLAPSLFYGGFGLRDPRYLPRIGAGALLAGGYPNQDCGWYWSQGGAVVCDQVPSIAAVANIAAAQNVVSGVPMALVGASGAGITLTTAAQTILPTGNVVPAGTLAIDGVPGYVGGGTSGGFQFMDPTTSLARAVSVTSTGGTGGVVIVHGYDVYGVPMSESITSVTGTTVDGKKAFKFVTSAVPQFTDATNYSIGTADVFGLNLRADKWAYVRAVWNDTLETANTGFVAADTTAATALTGDVRGTYAQTSDGAKALQLFVAPSVADLIVATLPLATQGLLGVTQA